MEIAQRRPRSRYIDALDVIEEHIEVASAESKPIAEPEARVAKPEHEISRPVSELSQVAATDDTGTLFGKAVAQSVTNCDIFYKYVGTPIKIQGGKFVAVKRPIWYVFLFLHGVRSLYFPCVLVAAISNDWSILDELQLFWLLTWTLAFNYSWILNYLLFIKHVDDLALLWNSMVQLKPRIEKIKMLHLFVIVFPYAQGIATVAICVFSALKPNLLSQMRFVVYYGRQNGYIESEWLYWTLTAIVIALDFVSLTVLGAVGVSAAAPSSCFLEIWNFLADALVKRMELTFSSDTRRNPHQLFSEMRQLEVFLRIFTISNSQAIFVIKLAAFSVSILGISSLFLLNFQSPIVSMVVAYFGILTLLGYPAMYSNANTVSENLQKFKEAARLQHRLMAHDAVFRREVEAISVKGVMVGSFRTFERESLLVFLDHVFNQVVSIVIAFG